MSISSIQAGAAGGGALQRACRRKLRSLGVGERQATQMAADELELAARELIRQASSDDQRVFPHAQGWLVTRDFDANGARFFRTYPDAERHARRAARNGSGTGILFYDEDGRATLYVDYPDWRQKKR